MAGAVLFESAQGSGVLAVCARTWSHRLANRWKAADGYRDVRVAKNKEEFGSEWVDACWSADTIGLVGCLWAGGGGVGARVRRMGRDRFQRGFRRILTTFASLLSAGRVPSV